MCGSSHHWHRFPALIFGRETVDSASGPASPVLAGYGRKVGSLGPGLTSDSADAVRAVLRDDLSAGPQVYGTRRRCRSDLPGLCKRPGFTGPTLSRPAARSSDLARIVPTGPDTRAQTPAQHRAGAAIRHEGLPRGTTAELTQSMATSPIA